MDLLNQAAKGFKRATNFDKLLPGAYKVNQFKFITTQYGPKIIVVADDVEVFLPGRFSENRTREDIEMMNTSLRTAPLNMIYKGKNKDSKNRVELHFEPL